MKRLFLLLAVACVGFASCSENLNGDDPNEIPSLLEELKKRFDFSEVNTDGLEIKKVYEFHDNEDNGRSTSNTITFVATHPDIVVIVGEIDKCLWLGLFDRESGKLKYQYTDVEHPVSYSVYGVNYEYGVGDIHGIYFEENDLVLAIQYFIKELYTARLDLISFDENKKAYRTTIDENTDIFYSCYGFRLEDNLIFTIRKWSANTIYLYYSTREQYDYKLMTIYDFLEKGLLCNIKINVNDDELVLYLFNLRSNPSFISLPNPLHFWYISYSGKISIKEFQCTYDTFTVTEKDIELFEPYTGDSSKAPRYSYEYKTKTDDHISVVVTQTEYDGTITQKTVDVRLIDDELKVEIQ